MRYVIVWENFNSEVLDSKEDALNYYRDLRIEQYLYARDDYYASYEGKLYPLKDGEDFDEEGILKEAKEIEKKQVQKFRENDLKHLKKLAKSLGFRLVKKDDANE